MSGRGEPRRVVAFGAHPDDVDLYAGGLVAGLSRRGVEVVLVDLTAGELGSRGNVRTRRKEAAESARILGARRVCLDLPDGRLAATDDDQNRAVTAALREYSPDFILAPWEEDLHPDHRQACFLIRRAHFLARVKHYDAEGSPGRPGGILYYEQKLPLVPDLIVDITPDIETKRAAVRAFGSQFSRSEAVMGESAVWDTDSPTQVRSADDPAGRTEISDPAFHEMLEARSRVHGYRIGVTWGEAYRREGPEAIHDPLDLRAAAFGSRPSGGTS